MKKRKGFTLIELLSVIVIIAIIAIIAVPIVLNIIEKSRKGAFLRTVDGYVHAIKNEYIVNILDGNNGVEEFIITNGKVNGNTITSNYNDKYNGLVNFDVTQNTYFVILSDGNYCAYKNYNDTTSKLTDIEFCDNYLDGVLFEPLIEVSDENKLTLTKNVIINFLNDKNTNQYCIMPYIGEDEISVCTNYITVDDSIINLTIDKNSVIYARVFDGENEIVKNKIVKNIGEEIIDKTPIINSLILSSDINSITATITATPYEGNEIVKYYYSIDDGEYIESDSQYNIFNELEPYIEHKISVYVLDNDGNVSKISSKTAKTLYEDKNPSVDNVTTSNTKDSITVSVDSMAFGGSLIKTYYYSIDGGEYAASQFSTHTFLGVTSFEKHQIRIYVEDNVGRASEVSNIEAWTSTVHKIPTIDSLTTTSGTNDITVTPTVTSYDGTTIAKYYYSIDGGEYIETTDKYYNFADLTDNVDHTFKVYVEDSMGAKSQVSTINALTNAAVPYLTMVVNNVGHEYNEELWYPYGTKVTLNYSADMTGKTGYYQTVNESSETVSGWTKAGTSSKKIVTVNESMTYKIKIINSDKTESEIVEKKINIMPRPNYDGGVPSRYYEYNMGGIYPIYIPVGTSKGHVAGTNKYRHANYQNYISGAAMHMGLVAHDGSKSTESKLVYIKLIPCPEEGYIGTDKNGISSNTVSYSSSYDGFMFVKEDGTEYISPEITNVVTTSGENNIAITVTAEAKTNGAKIDKYYYSIDKGEYIESSSNYYNFENLTPYINHTINVYTVDNDGIVSTTSTVMAATTKEMPIPTITLDSEGYEYNGELWYPYGTKATITYSADMTNLTGYYQTVNESSGKGSNWTSNGTKGNMSVSLSESITYKVKIIDKVGRETIVVEKKLNVMPRPSYNGGVPSNYYEYNMGGIYPVYIPVGTSKGQVDGTNKYRHANYQNYISGAAMHMGLVAHDGSKTTESKLVYIKLIPCPEEGYIGSTRNGISSSTVSYSSSYNGFMFVTEDGTEIIIEGE